MDHSAEGSSTSRHQRSPGSPRPPRGSSKSPSSGSGLTPTQLRALAERHGIRPDKSLGQNFLADPNTARLIVSLAGIAAGDRVVEVGAGLGSLTVPMAETGASVTAIEFDRGVAAGLRESVEGLSVDVLERDAMKIDWPGLLGGGRWKMVSNLPYNIATPLLLDMLSAGLPIETYLVMIQREVGERLVARAGEDAYGAVSIRVEWFAEAELVRRVPPTVFWPPPKVESVLVRLKPREGPPVDADPAVLFRLIEEGFAQRRKTMANALKRLGATGDEAARALASCGLRPDVRAEDMSLQDLAALGREVSIA